MAKRLEILGLRSRGIVLSDPCTENKALVNCAVTVQLICSFVYAYIYGYIHVYEISRFSPDVVHFI